MSVAQSKAGEASKGETKAVSDLVTPDVHDITALEKRDDVTKTDDMAKYKKGVIRSTIKTLCYGKKFLKSTSEVPEGEQFGHS